MCVETTLFDSDEYYYKHLKMHYEFLFKCKICSLGFEEWKSVLRHIAKNHSESFKNVENAVVLPENKDRLLNVRCKLKKCRRQFCGLTLSEVEQHQHHWFSRKKLGSCLEWSCRLCTNRGSIHKTWEGALGHVKLHIAGLIIASKELESDSETSSGGFSSGEDFISSAEEGNISNCKDSE